MTDRAIFVGSHAPRHPRHTRCVPERPPPPSGHADAPVDRFVTPVAYETPYGKGIFRRRLRLVNLTPTHTAGELEDDFHHFRVDLHHDGATIERADGQFFRGPWTVCAEAPDPLRAIEGRPLTRSSTGIGAYTAARDNCTHLFDLAGLVVAHAARAEATRQYDIELTDPSGPARASRGTIWRNGELVLEWQIEDSEIVSPPPWPDAPLRRGFIGWAEANLGEDEAEAAIALRRIIDIAIGRGGNLDLLDTAVQVGDVMMGKCQAFSPAKIELGVRNRGSARDFKQHAELLLADMHLRDR
jgi:Protein of unknown function (DUF2889)